MKTKSKIEEKKLTKAELETREKVMKDLKKNKSALVKRYGKDAEAVMYGRATNIAKKMAESENKNKIKEMVRKALMQEADIEVGADRYEGEKDLGQASALLDDLEAMLKRYDWFYYMSDDPRVYKYEEPTKRIAATMNQLKDLGYGEDAKTLYNQYAPNRGDIDLRIKEGKKEDVDGDGDIDSKDYLAKRDAAIKKAKGDIDESGYREMTDSERSKKQYMDQQLKRLSDLKKRQEDKERLLKLQQKLYQDRMDPLMREGELEEAYVPSNIKEFAKRKGATSLVNKVAGWAEKAGKGIRGGTAIGKNYSTLVLDLGFQDGSIRINLDDDTVTLYDEEIFDAKSFKQVYLDNQEESKDSEMNEDIDLGHEDNEPHMIKSELYRIGKYAMELYAMAEELEETGQEIDFPSWWQSMITDASTKMVKAKHYLDFELKEPAIDAFVDKLTGEEPHEGEPEPPMMEGEVTKVDKLAAKIAKALKDPKNQDAEDQNNIKQARKAMNDDYIKAAEKLIKPYLAEKISKKLKEAIGRNYPEELDGEYEGKPQKIKGVDIYDTLRDILDISNSENDFIIKMTDSLTDETSVLSKSSEEKLRNWYKKNVTN